MRGRQLNELRRGLHSQQLMGVVKGAVGICTGDLDDLAVVVCGALRGRHGRTIPSTDMDIVYMT
jgi:hypothetical protein